jgi:exodeoxyribonuclease V alpha subunit
VISQPELLAQDVPEQGPRYGIQRVTVSVAENGVLFDRETQFIFRAFDNKEATARYVANGSLPRCPQPGECWELDYRDDEHEYAASRELGYQRKVVSGNLLHPTGSYLVGLFAYHPALRGLGIGPKKAAELYRLHGTRLVDYLNNGDAEAISGLSGEIAWELIERWKALAIEPEVVKWFTQHNLPSRVAAKIHRLYGARSVEMLEVNPYCLHTFLPFAEVDALATRRLQVPLDDPNRLIAVVENILYRAMERGHTAVQRAHLEQSLRMNVPGQEARAVALALERECAFARGEFIQAVAPAVMERFIERWITERKESYQGDLEMLEDGAEQRLAHHAAADSIELNTEQREAVLGAFREHAHCIVGGAGVGKTTVLRMLANLILEANGIACFMAISGRAARRIAESLGAELAPRCRVQTVAGYLHSQRSDETRVHDDSAPWLVVDEASMLDLQSAYQVLARSPAKSRLVLVGDPGQLPPVGCGLVFHRMVETRRIKTTELTHVYRQAAATGIPTIAQDIRRGRWPGFLAFQGPGLGVQMRETKMGDAVSEAIRIASILAAAGPVQILTLFKANNGARAVNLAMHAALPPETKRLATAALNFAVGEPVIFKRNNTELNLQNGSVGRVRSIDNANKSITVEWDDGRELSMKGLDLWDCDLAHGITTHKSQGSQYERVVIVIPRPSLILDRSLLYTAVTRAKRQAVIVGDPAAIRKAIEAPAVSSRRTVLLLE